MWTWEALYPDGWAPIDRAGLDWYAKWRKGHREIGPTSSWQHGWVRLRGEWHV